MWRRGWKFFQLIAVLSATGMGLCLGLPGIKKFSPVPEPQQETNESGFRLALPGYRYSFPRDHGSHPPYATEWWYYTGHLKSGDGLQRFGYQLTFFRRALVPHLRNRRSRWATRDVILAHLALTDETSGRFYYCDRVSRAAQGLAGAEAFKPANTRIWLGDWKLDFGKPGQYGPMQQYRAGGRDIKSETSFALELTQTALKPAAVHGVNGVSQKSSGRGRASHYYSFTRLKTAGTVSLAGKDFEVTGESWFDHEFGSNQLSENQTGWDWFSLQLDDGRELMLYQLRLTNGSLDPYSSGTFIGTDGAVRHLKRNDFKIVVRDFWMSPETKARYPARWLVTLPSENISLEIEPVLAAQELTTKRSTGVAYWEGSVTLYDAHDKKNLGRGYVELTGYAEAFDGTF